MIMPYILWSVSHFTLGFFMDDNNYINKKVSTWGSIIYCHTSLNAIYIMARYFRIAFSRFRVNHPLDYLKRKHLKRYIHVTLSMTCSPSLTRWHSIDSYFIPDRQRSSGRVRCVLTIDYFVFRMTAANRFSLTSILIRLFKRLNYR
jgi:hypothetical protein